jgi:oligosaccharide repeat unit polymerase
VQIGTFYLFQFGHYFIFLFWPGEIPYFLDNYYFKISGSSYSFVSFCAIVSVLFGFFFVFGQLVYLAHAKPKETSLIFTIFSKTHLSQNDIDKVVFFSSLVLFMFSFPLGMYQAIDSAKFVIRLGYRGFIEANITYPKIFNFSIFILPSGLLLFLFSKHKLIKIGCFSLVSVYEAITLLEGGRTSAICYAVLVLVYLFSLLKGLSKKKQLVLSFLLLAIIYAFSVLVSAIANYRNADNQTIAEFFSILLSTLRANKTISSVVWEFGFTSTSLPFSIKYLGSTYHYGLSYFAALSGLFPSIFDFTGLIQGLHDYASVDSALYNLLYPDILTFGPGTSMVAEAFLNFGWFGFLPMFFLGYIFTLFSSFDLFPKNDPFSSYISLVLSGVILIMPRRPFLFFVTYFFYYVIVIFVFLGFNILIYWFFRKKKRQND